jgi:hypothetical protein
MNVPYHSARMEGKIVRVLYRAALTTIIRQPVRVAREVPFEVFAYSGERSLPEQVASVRSFLANVGRPNRFVVVSDGSYTKANVELLEKIDSCVQVQTTAPSLPPGLPAEVQSFLTKHFTGKQLALIMSLPMSGPALYTDADVLFFPQAPDLIEIAGTESVPAFYLADYQFSADPRLIRSDNEKENPVNMGFLFLFQKLDWSLSLERLKMLTGTPNFFTTQTVVHLCMHANGGRPFDSQKFILQADDEFIYRDAHAGSSIAIRHYVNPIRHKFWTSLARLLPS